MALGLHQNIEQQQAPAFFARGPSPFARLAFFASLSLALMATDSRLQYLTPVRENLMAMLHPLQVLANAPSRLYEFTGQYFSTHHYLLNENRQLKKQILNQSIALQKLDTLTLENGNLRDLLQANKALYETSFLGEIVHVGRDLFTKKVIVNRGTSHGIVAGSAVVDAMGVIGQITRTYPSSSEVTLITDKSLAIPIQIERNGLRAIAFGHGRDNTLDLPYLPANVDIRRGDKLVTSGIDGVYPAGLAVATVSTIKVSPDSPFARIVCVPTGGIENHKQVLLVSMPQPETLPSTVDITNDKQTATNNKTNQPTTPVNPNKEQTAQPQVSGPPNNTTNQKPKKPQPNQSSKPHAQQ